MKKVLLVCLFLLHNTVTYAAYNADKHNWLVAKNLVERVAEFANETNQLALFSAINHGKLTSQNSYVFALSTVDAKVLAHPREELLHKDNPLDKKYTQRMLNIIHQYGQGWIEYHFIDPATGRDVPKLSYIKRISDSVFIGAGVY